MSSTFLTLPVEILVQLFEASIQSAVSSALALASTNFFLNGIYKLVAKQCAIRFLEVSIQPDFRFASLLALLSLYPGDISSVVIREYLNHFSSYSGYMCIDWNGRIVQASLRAYEMLSFFSGGFDDSHFEREAYYWTIMHLLYGPSGQSSNPDTSLEERLSSFFRLTDCPPQPSNS